MKLEYLRSFIAVAEAGDLAGAGTRIGRTPAALSMTLKQMEADLGGGALFEGERKARLTPLGAYTLLQARKAVNECDALVANIRNFANGELGMAQVAAVPTAATRVIPLAIQRLRAKRPEARVELRDFDSAAVVQAVSIGAVDFGIATLAGVETGIETEFLLEDPFVLVCPARHPLVDLHRPIRWSDIDANEFIANGLCASICLSQVADLTNRARLTVRNTTSLIAFIEQGFGITLLPALAAPQSNTLRTLKLEDGSVRRRLDLLMRQGSSPSPAAAALLLEVRDVVKEMVL